MLERDVRIAVHRHLPTSIYRQSNTGLVIGGTPDTFYEGNLRDLWIEWKNLKHMPRDRIAKGDYSALQLRWMERRFRKRGANSVLGIVALPDKTAVIQVTPNDWESGTYTSTARSFKEVAAWITDYCGG